MSRTFTRRFLVVVMLVMVLIIYLDVATIVRMLMIYLDVAMLVLMSMVFFNVVMLASIHLPPLLSHPLLMIMAPREIFVMPILILQRGQKAVKMGLSAEELAPTKGMSLLRQAVMAAYVRGTVQRSPTSTPKATGAMCMPTFAMMTAHAMKVSVFAMQPGTALLRLMLLRKGRDDVSPTSSPPRT